MLTLALTAAITFAPTATPEPIDLLDTPGYAPMITHTTDGYTRIDCGSYSALYETPGGYLYCLPI